MAISKNKIKFITSLKQKKEREDNKLFVIEGEKMVNELINSNLTIKYIIGLPSWINRNKPLLFEKGIDVIEANEEELSKISSQKTPNQVIAVAKQPEYTIHVTELNNNLSLFLDDIQDPGNLGTIIRIADWFGINHVLCSENTVDVFNPKVVQATMGAIFRVKVEYFIASKLLHEVAQNNIPIYGAFLDGENIYKTNLEHSGIIVMGNESKGINNNLEHLINKRITIPTANTAGLGSESLNVSVATSIICAEFTRRRLFT